MKTTIKTILLSLCLTTTFFCNAQDASNDATWEETVEFIESTKKNYLNFYVYKESRSMDIKQLSFSSLDLTIEGEGSYNLESSVKESIKLVNIDLSKLKRADVWYRTLNLEFTSEKAVAYSQISYSVFYIRDWQPLRKRDDFNKDFIKIKLTKDDEMLPRIEKAFQHLAYLATKKREEERNASGSKF
ncbi:hypothetical protein SAMN05216503_1967 [Polaribacter sp. KT25b]|uniref:hypothetical protein n=1 Tax=Polaribacter sp. KT25b TaxID=1855336 RepID=UPI00087920B9|nr:hypothetical protein [Polaribacter sp. KT25b]SDS09632.1 hypothetical protein SAMN05216503_1967 [Polaribacter sp. KT25b]